MGSTKSSDFNFFICWIGLDWIGLDWIGLDWIGLDWIRLNEDYPLLLTPIDNSI